MRHGNHMLYILNVMSFLVFQGAKHVKSKPLGHELAHLVLITLE
jgi:hypothetical protein